LPEECHNLLKLVDPTMASYLHIMDKRKIVNAIFKYFKMLRIENEKAVSKLKQSDVLKQTNTLRFLPILIWIKADVLILEKRIRKRV
jgi:tRNA A37 N6-isopentenylltransferase MiaA